MSKGGGFKGMPGNLQGMMQQAQKMKEDMEKAQSKLKNQEFDAQAGGGMVKIKMKGEYELVSLEISREVIDPNDKEMLEDLVKAVISEVIATIKNCSQNEMSKVTGGVSIPGLF
jgi:nucleoid-associated protein EbfC